VTSNDDQQPSGIIVAGMHRSGTSLVTSAFGVCGYQLAPDQLPPEDDNPKGFFEDRQMHMLHRRWLESLEAGWDLSPRLRELREQDLRLPAHLETETQELVDYYGSVRPWVWKNPRATLFLDEWARRFPEATFVICLRTPAAVVDSMSRRKSRLRISSRRKLYRTRRLMRGLSLWRTYNLMALRFANAHRDRTVVLRIPADLDVLQQSAPQMVFEPGLLKRPRKRVAWPAALALRCQVLHWRLSRLAEPARVAALLDAPRRHPVEPAPGENGHMTLDRLIGVAGSIALGGAVEIGYNLAF
jgi:hypothetical protein